MTNNAHAARTAAALSTRREPRSSSKWPDMMPAQNPPVVLHIRIRPNADSDSPKPVRILGHATPSEPSGNPMIAKPEHATQNAVIDLRRNPGSTCPFMAFSGAVAPTCTP